jgi:hypothetical protein
LMAPHLRGEAQVAVHGVGRRGVGEVGSCSRGT